MPAVFYCGTCGGRYDDNIKSEAEHVCPGGQDDDPQWCEYCGAELMDTGSCDNPHDEDDE